MKFLNSRFPDVGEADLLNLGETAWGSYLIKFPEAQNIV